MTERSRARTIGATPAVYGVAAVLLLTAGCRNQQDAAVQRSQPPRRAVLLRDTILNLRDTFAAGRLMAKRSGRFDREDSRMALIPYQMRKLKRNFQMRLEDPTAREAALAKLAQAERYFHDEILPRYQQALESESPQEAQALAPLMDRLAQYVDDLLEIVHK